MYWNSHPGGVTFEGEINVVQATVKAPVPFSGDSDSQSLAAHYWLAVKTSATGLQVTISAYTEQFGPSASAVFSHPCAVTL